LTVAYGYCIDGLKQVSDAHLFKMGVIAVGSESKIDIFWGAFCLKRKRERVTKERTSASNARGSSRKNEAVTALKSTPLTPRQHDPQEHEPNPHEDADRNAMTQMAPRKSTSD
jgi:hypothetical protein